MKAPDRPLTAVEESFVADVERAFYVAFHRAPRNEPLDKVRSLGTPYQPKHCGCQACSHGFGHVTGVAR